jgi:hypothetical protein
MWTGTILKTAERNCPDGREDKELSRRKKNQRVKWAGWVE